MSTSSASERADSVSFQYLRVFEAVGNCESVRRASEKCRLSQPAVTQALAKFEQNIGAELVIRRASGSYLNEFGQILHARIKRMFERIEEGVVDLGVKETPELARPVVNRLTRTQIRALVAVIRHGSFEGASQALGISSASLKRATRDLERNLEVTLFYRNAAGILVNPLGRRFGAQMKLALQEIEWGFDEVASAQGGAGLHIVVGAMPLGGSMLLASCLDTFLRLHPRAEIRIINDSAAAMLKSLSTGDVDLVIGLLPHTDLSGLAYEALSQTPYSIVARRGHPLAKKGRITVDDLAAYDWIVGNPGSCRRACFEGLFAGRERAQAPIATCATTIIRHLLSQSDRLTLMTNYELDHQSGDLCAIPFGPILPVPSIGVTRRANWLPTRIHLDFLQALRASMIGPSGWNDTKDRLPKVARGGRQDAPGAGLIVAIN